MVYFVDVVINLLSDDVYLASMCIFRVQWLIADLSGPVGIGV
jgi:hypothetical protein